MGKHAPIYYTADADTFCPECAERVYGAVTDYYALDTEGNNVGAAAPWDEAPEHGVYCGECGVEIVPPTDEYRDVDVEG